MQHCLLWSIWAQGDAEKLFCAFIIPSFCSCRSSLSDCPTSGKNLLLIQNASVRALIGISRRFDILLLQLERQEFKLTCKVNRFVPFFAEYIFPYKCYIFRVKVEDTNMFANASNKRWKKSVECMINSKWKKWISPPVLQLETAFLLKKRREEPEYYPIRCIKHKPKVGHFSKALLSRISCHCARIFRPFML